jgi:hypothetical protein
MACSYARASAGPDVPTGGDKTQPHQRLSEMKYVAVRRLFIYIEHFIEECAYWAVFGPGRALMKEG